MPYYDFHADPLSSLEILEWNQELLASATVPIFTNNTGSQCRLPVAVRGGRNHHQQPGTLVPQTWLCAAEATWWISKSNLEVHTAQVNQCRVASANSRKKNRVALG